MSTPIVLVLDDSETRHEIFREALWDYQIEHTYSIKSFRLVLQELERPPVVISLDHDLEGIYNTHGGPNTCGCDAAESVSQLMPPSIPVLIHSANNPCAQVMRTILLRGKRTGRVARVNIATMTKHEQQAGVRVIRQAISELVASPCWPEDVNPDELLELLGDNPNLICPVRWKRR